jgi:orotate phosphoribosyltransferase
LKDYLSAHTQNVFFISDREQGGLSNISAHGIKLHSILKTNDVIKVLFDGNKITKDAYEKTLEFLNSHKNIVIPDERPISNHVIIIYNFI